MAADDAADVVGGDGVGTNFSPSERSLDLAQSVRDFIDTEVEPAERVTAADIAARRNVGEDPWPAHPLLQEPQGKARSQGQWNLFLLAGPCRKRSAQRHTGRRDPYGRHRLDDARSLS